MCQVQIALRALYYLAHDFILFAPQQTTGYHRLVINQDIPVSAELALKLREVNQNLVISSVQTQQLLASAEAANRQKNEFLSMLAHELRNPLAPIVMAAGILRKILSAHPQLPQIHDIISRQAAHMTQLIDSLTEASRVNTGKITLHKRLLLLSEVIENAAGISQPFIDARKQKLIVNLPTVPIVIDGDLVRLAQVFSNLLINATKFAPEHDHITVSARLLPDAVTVSVKDHGVGITPELAPLIFDLFTQGPRTLERSQGGLGIGLSLVRTLTEMHGGTASVHSDGDGLGSEFIITLPLSSQDLPGDEALVLAAAPVSPRRILIIEDNRDANEILNFCLSLDGHTVTSAFDGPTGLNIALENHFDIIFCDIGLPGMNGYELIKQLRASCFKPIPICIAITGYDQPDYQNQGLEAGFDRYLVKPISVDALTRLIANLYPHQTADASRF